MKVFPRLRRFWLAWLRPCLAAAAVVYPLKSSLGDINFVPTGSMKPTILEGDFVFVNKIAYDLKVPFTTRRLAEWSGPSRGDVVVLFSPVDGMRLVKRLVAVPGDTIELRSNVLFVNGRRAGYQPVAAGELRYVAPSDVRDAQFATETVENRSHAIMASPAVYSAARSMRPLVLGPDEYFVMGDNRDHSKDSRYFGVVPGRLIVGKAVGVVASVDKPGRWLPRFGRFFSALN
jgi:signal peptidase I